MQKVECDECLSNRLKIQRLEDNLLEVQILYTRARIDLMRARSGLGEQWYSNNEEKEREMKKVEFEFITDVPNEVRPVLIDSSNALEDGHILTEEEIANQFDKLFDNE